MAIKPGNGFVEPRTLATARGGARSFLHKATRTLESVRWEKGFRHTRSPPKSVTIDVTSRASWPALENAAGRNYSFYIHKR